MLTLLRCVLQKTCFAGQHRNIATYLQNFIVQNTEVVSGQLTPELRLHLLTPRCKHWHLPPEFWPYADPYWAIYWPGGQALARYILDNPHIVLNKRVLDLGCGCGAAAIAAKMGGASYVLANDIDPVAGAAFSLNCQLNSLKPLSFSTDNIIAKEAEDWNLIVIGDMFYDERLTDHLSMWLKLCITKHPTKVLIGDPGRYQFVSHSIQKQLRKLKEYSLQELTRQENYGLTTSAVFCYEP